MASIPQQILTSIAQVLTDAGLVPAGRVLLDQFDPLPAAALPVLLVYEGEGGERLVQDMALNDLQRRRLDVRIECLVTQSITAAEQARQLGLQVEQAMGASELLRAWTGPSAHLLASQPALNGSTQQLNAARIQMWAFDYLTDPDDPETIL